MTSRPFRRAFRLALRRPDLVESEIDEEIAFHLQERIDALVDRGWSASDARAEAIRRFGDPLSERPALFAAAHTRERRLDALEWLDTVRTDLRVAARQLRRAPSFALGTIVALALGIGANATMFGVIDRLLLRAPAQIASPGDVYTIGVGATERLSYPAFTNLRDNLSSVASVAVQTSPMPMPVGRGDNGQMAQTAFADGAYFRTLGVRPAVGRLLSDADAALPDGQPAAVIGFGMWQARFNGDLSVIGRELIVGSGRARVVGVAPRDFNGLGTHTVDLWLPLPLAGPLTFFGPDWATMENRWLYAVARVAPHVDPALVAKRATAIGHAALLEHTITDTVVTAELKSILPSRGKSLTREAKIASLLGAVSLLVLLIACSNAANLMLARAVRRRREIGIRMALGVSRGRLVAQLLTDSMFLSTLGGIAAVVVALAGSALMRGVLLAGSVWQGSLIDAQTLAFIVCAVVVTGLLTGLVPAFVLLRRFDLSQAIGKGRQSGGVHRHRVISSLVVTQTVLSSVLLIGAVLFVRSLANVQHLSLGMDTEHTVIVLLDSKAKEARSNRIDQLFNELRTQVARVPGVSDAAIAEAVPYDWHLQVPISVPGRAPGSPAEQRAQFLSAVSSTYFSAIGTRILQGRAFTAAEDQPAGEPVAILGERLAKRLWPGGDAIGHCVRIGADSTPCRRIVGIVEDTRELSTGALAFNFPYLYVPLSQGRHSTNARALVAHISVPAADVIPLIRSAVQSVDRSLPFSDVWQMQSRLDPELRPWRLGATMFGVFGALALVLAALGLYSVIAYSVAQRTAEMGIRIALGASASHILSLVGRQGAILAGAGVVIATLAAAILAPLVQPLLFQTSARSAPTYAIVACTMLIVALAASLIPARRAAGVDPISVMRSE